MGGRAPPADADVHRLGPARALRMGAARHRHDAPLGPAGDRRLPGARARAAHRRPRLARRRPPVRPDVRVGRDSVVDRRATAPRVGHAAPRLPGPVRAELPRAARLRLDQHGGLPIGRAHTRLRVGDAPRARLPANGGVAVRRATRRRRDRPEACERVLPRRSDRTARAVPASPRRCPLRPRRSRRRSSCSLSGNSAASGTCRCLPPGRCTKPPGRSSPPVPASTCRGIRTICEWSCAT